MGEDTDKSNALREDTAAVIERCLRVLASEDSEMASMRYALTAAERLAHLGAPGIDALGQVLRNWGDYDPSALFAAIQALGDSGDPRAAVPLREVVRFPPADKLMAEDFRAANALARLGASGADVLAEGVKSPLLGSETRWSIAPVLGSTGTEEQALAPLIAALENREDPFAASAAAKGLGNLGSAEAVPALIAALGEEPPVGNAAQGALYNLDKAAIPPLLQVLVDGSDVARRRAAWTLCWMAGYPQARNGLLTAIDDPDADVRGAAVCALRDHGDVEALSILERKSQDDHSIVDYRDTVAELAEEAIRAIKSRAAGNDKVSEADESAQLDQDEESVDEADIWDDPEWYLHYQEETTDEIIARLVREITLGVDDPVDDGRTNQAAYSLAHLGPSGMGTLATLARDQSADYFVREAALDGLGSSNDEEALPVLLEVLHDPASRVLALQATYALSTLGSVGSPVVVDALVETMADDSTNIYTRAPEQALVRIGETAIPALVRALAEGPEGQRRGAVRALRDLSAYPEAAKALFAALHDSDAVVREQAVEGVVHRREGIPGTGHSRGDRDAVQALLTMLDDPDASVLRAARDGVSALGGLDEAFLLERAGSRVGHVSWDGGEDTSAEIARNLRTLAMRTGGYIHAASVWRAAHALARLGKLGVAALDAVLHDPSLYPHSSRVWALDALGASGDAQAVTPLLDALRGTLPEPPEYEFFTEELRAAHALARLGEPGRAVLTEIAQDAHASERARRAAKDALSSET